MSLAHSPAKAAPAENRTTACRIQFRGAEGALATILSLLAVPSAVVVGLDFLCDHFHDEGPIRHLFPGLAAAAAGLLVSMAVKLALPLLGEPAAIAITAIAILRAPLPPTLLVLAPVSMLAMWKVGHEHGAPLPHTHLGELSLLAFGGA
jgi:chromate transporter